MFSAIAWDGFLPLSVAAVPVVVKSAWGRIGAAEFYIASVFVPMSAMLARGFMMRRHLVQACGNSPPESRQLLAFAAIAVLFIVEVLVGMITMFGNAGLAAWSSAAAYYLLYVFLIFLSLRPTLPQKWKTEGKEDWGKENTIPLDRLGAKNRNDR